MEKREILKGSYRTHPADVQVLEVPADKNITLSIILRRRKELSEYGPMTHEHHAANYGSTDEDVRAVDTFCAQHGFTVTEVHVGSRTVKITGKLSALADVFGAQLQWSCIGDKGYRTRSGSLLIPADLEEIIVAVFGFDERPQAKTHHTVRPHNSEGVSYLPAQVAKAYGFPTNNGAGQTVGIIELGGGYRQSDLTAFWKLAGVPNVSVTAVGVDGATNAPTGSANSADGEVGLDIEVVGGIAPGASMAVYFAPNTDSGFYDGFSAMIHDKVRKPKVVSCSWGGPEVDWTPQTMNAFNALFQDAAALGITVCIASGDNGADDGVGDGNNHVDFPASSPWAIACGGTSLQLTSKGSIASEVVWNDGAQGGASGGGFSSFFTRPLYYQAGIKQPGNMRGVPDVAGVADPATGWTTIIDGTEGTIGGTSAVAPMFSGLIALCNQELAATAGWIGKVIYLGDGPQAFNDITSGNNGVPGLTNGYDAGPGWDACCGLGTPKGAKVLALLKQHRGAKA